MCRLSWLKLAWLWNFFTFPCGYVDSGTVSDMASVGASEAQAPPDTILFVEDEALVRMDMAEFLRECGFRVQEAADANEALEILQAEFAVDLLFTDINLPNSMNGLELAEWTFNNLPGIKVRLQRESLRQLAFPKPSGLYSQSHTPAPNCWTG